jgi:hypothetical protein
MNLNTFIVGNFIRKIISFAVIIVLISLTYEFSEGASIGVSPGNIQFKNMLRDGYAERSVIISIANDRDVIVGLSSRGEIEDWLNFSDDKFIISSGSPEKVFLTVQPPPDVENGVYSGTVRISTEGLGSISEGQAGSVIKASVDLQINVEITDVVIEGCKANEFQITSAEKEDNVVFSVNILNEGNVRLRPTVSLDIWNQDQTEIVKIITWDKDEILPTVTSQVEVLVSTDDLEIDQYWVDATVIQCFAEDILTFDVIEPGSLRSFGVLKQILVQPFVNIGQPAHINAIFQNTGEKQIVSQFIGNIKLSGTVVESLESEELEVGIGEIINYTMFYEPKDIGRYAVSGRFFYDKKRTYESSTFFTAVGVDEGSIIPSIITTILVVLILILSWKIRKERIRRRNT